MSRTRVPVTSISIVYERDVVVARQQARKIAELAGFDHQDQIRIATSISELARNAFQYAGGGRVVTDAELTPNENAIIYTIKDEGRGIANLEHVLSGQYKSTTGMGKGLIGSRRLMDTFTITSSPEAGTVVEVSKRLPKKAPTLDRERVEQIRHQLGREIPDDPFYELQRQNQELMRMLDELRSRQEELSLLNSELEATNRGVVALYAELDERANYLRKVSDQKSGFFSNMSHELRTPLNSIRTLAGMLLERMDGPLEEEQEKQVNYIRNAAEELGLLVDDLLDLAKAEAGKLTVRLGVFDISSLFNLLRGLLKPLTKGGPIALVLEQPNEEIQIYSDEGKVSQILRNFISNALKFTEEGEVRVTALQSDDFVTFQVKDTGIGIKPEHMGLVFEEFSQIESTVQNHVKGTGLGLPLSRRLAELLGGRVWAESEPGVGSSFFVSIPLEGQTILDHSGREVTVSSDRIPGVLIIDDDHVARYVLQAHLAREGYQVTQASSGEEGLRLSHKIPEAIFLDLSMPGMSGQEVLEQLKAENRTRDIPVIINTSMSLTQEEEFNLQARGATLVLSKGKSFLEKATLALQDILQ